jgi:hypothetical protein
VCRRFSIKDRAPLPNPAPWANCIYRFWGGGDEYRNRTFKLFPRMCKSSWAIQAAVGKKPALIGNKKLELTYTRGRNYLEIDIDLSSSTIATHILGMVSMCLSLDLLSFAYKFDTRRQCSHTRKWVLGNLLAERLIKTHTNVR